MSRTALSHAIDSEAIERDQAAIDQVRSDAQALRQAGLEATMRGARANILILDEAAEPQPAPTPRRRRGRPTNAEVRERVAAQVAQQQEELLRTLSVDPVMDNGFFVPTYHDIVRTSVQTSDSEDSELDEDSEEGQGEPEMTNEDREHEALLELVRNQEAEEKKAKAEKAPRKIAKPREPKIVKNTAWINECRDLLKSVVVKDADSGEVKAMEALRRYMHVANSNPSPTERYIIQCAMLGKEDLVIGKKVKTRRYCTPPLSNGIIVKIKVDPREHDYRMWVDIVDDGGKIIDRGVHMSLNYCDITESIELPIPEKKLTPPELIGEMFTAIQLKTKTEQRNLTLDLARRKKDMAFSKIRVRDYMKQARELESKIRQVRETSATPKGLLSEIEMLVNHEYVNDVYFSNKGNIFVETVPLEFISKATGKKNGKPLGRMLFRYSYTQTNSSYNVMAHNLDYTYGGHGHPNISSAVICQGENQREIKSMYQNMQLYALTDFLITFFTLYPQDGGNPYVGFTDYIRGRVKLAEQSSPFNPYREEVRIK